MPRIYWVTILVVSIILGAAWVLDIGPDATPVGQHWQRDN